MNKIGQVSLRMPDELRERLEALAQKEGRSLSNMIVHLVKSQLAARGAK